MAILTPLIDHDARLLREIRDRVTRAGTAYYLSHARRVALKALLTQWLASIKEGWEADFLAQAQVGRPPQTRGPSGGDVPRLPESHDPR